MNKKIFIKDATLCNENNPCSFKEKVEIARQLELLGVNTIELPAIANKKADVLLVRTLSSFVKNASLSVAVTLGKESLEDAIEALSSAKNPCIRVALPVSTVGMEYICHTKADKMLPLVASAVKEAVGVCKCVEFRALDATRTDEDFLASVLTEAKNAGACALSLSDDAGNLLPDDFAAFVGRITEKTGLSIGVSCTNKFETAISSALLAVKSGAASVNCSVGNAEFVPLGGFLALCRSCRENYGIDTDIDYSKLERTVRQILWITYSDKTSKKPVSEKATASEDFEKLNSKCTKEELSAAIVRLGYDLSLDDVSKVYEEFCRVAANKEITGKDLETIVASAALQVPETYSLISYVINSGNKISSSAQITLERANETVSGISIGNGPVDAAFMAIDSVIGHRYELDDFQIQAVTEGKEAMGAALVKLRYEGKLYSGNGLSTDIIGASIRAYLNAVNKIVYEENEK